MAASITTPYVSATYEGRYGTYTLDIYGPSPTSTTTLTMAEAPVVVFGDPSPIFGGGLVATSADYRLVDPAGVLDGLFGDSFDSEDWEVRLSGPNGRGGTWGVYTRPMQGELQASASPLTRANAPAGLGTHDGLAALADVTGTVTGSVSLSDLFARLWYAMPGRLGDVTGGIWNILADAPITIPEATDSLTSSLRYTGELFGDEESSEGDYGTVEDQMLALCEAMTLSIYQPHDAPGTWEVRMRSRVGSSGTGTEIEGDALTTTSAALAYTDRTTALPSFTEDEAGTQAGRIRRVSKVEMRGDSQVAYNIPGFELGDFDVETIPLGVFGVTAGLRFYVPDARTVYVDGAGTATLGEYRLELAGDDGTTYYGPDWATGAQVMTPDAATTDDLPVGGTVSLILVGEDDNLDTDNDAGTPDETVAAVFSPSTVTLEDAAGDPIVDYLLTIGATGGESIELTVPPDMEAWDGAAWQAATSYTSDVGTSACATVAACTAEIRLAQQSTNLRHLLVDVSGIWGPESRFTLAGTGSGNTTSPFAEDVTFIAVGGEVNLHEGWTRLSLVSAAES